MALLKGTNSYATVEEAYVYFSDRLDVAAWYDATDVTRAQSLVTATQLVDDLAFVGSAVSASQPLAFPRDGEYFDPRLGMSVILGATVPSRIVKAVYEIAYHLLNNDGLLDESGGVDTLSVSGISLNRITAPPKMPGMVRKSLRPLLLNGGASSWWRAN